MIVCWTTRPQPSLIPFLSRTCQVPHCRYSLRPKAQVLSRQWAPTHGPSTDAPVQPAPPAETRPWATTTPQPWRTPFSHTRTSIQDPAPAQQINTGVSYINHQLLSFITFKTHTHTHTHTHTYIYIYIYIYIYVCVFLKTRRWNL